MTEDPPAESFIDLSAPAAGRSARSPLGRRRRRASAVAVGALAAVLAGGAGYAALRPALLPGPSRAPVMVAPAEPPVAPWAGRMDVPSPAADPVHRR